MRDASDQELCRIARQDRVRIECYNVADERKPAGIANYCAERITRAPAQELVELRELAALALPAHPRALFRIPQARTMKQKKDISSAVSVLGVERSDSRFCGRENLAIVGAVFGWRVGEVAED